MTIVITSGVVVFILHLLVAAPLIGILGPLLLYLGAIAIVIISAIWTLVLWADGEFVTGLIVGIPVWLAIYWGHNQSQKEPVSEKEILNSTTFTKMLDKYHRTVNSLTDKPDELEKYVQEFEKKFLIGKKMLHLMGALEWELTWNDNKSRKWRYETIKRNEVEGQKEKQFVFERDNIRVVLSPVEMGYSYEDKQRNLDIYVGKKHVASFFASKHSDSYYDWGEGGDVYMRSFRPDEWLEILFNVYLQWRAEKVQIQTKESMAMKQKNVQEKYL